MNETNKKFDLGLIPMSAKPFHIGHEFLINEAAKNCTNVILFVSTKDRKRKNEMPISGKKMKEIWDDYLLNLLPQNVTVTFTESSPVKDTYKLLNSLKDSKTKIATFSDSIDTLNYDYENATNISFKRKIESPNICGKSMREFIAQNDFKNFDLHSHTKLPQEINKKIFEKLKNKSELIKVF